MKRSVKKRTNFPNQHIDDKISSNHSYHHPGKGNLEIRPLMSVDMHPPLLLLTTPAAPDGVSLSSSSGMWNSSGVKDGGGGLELDDVLVIGLGAVVVLTITSASGGGGGSGSRDGGDRLGRDRGSRGGDESGSGGDVDVAVVNWSDDVVVSSLVVNNRGSGLSTRPNRILNQIRALHHARHLDARLNRHISPHLALVRGAGELLRIARVLNNLALLLLPDVAPLLARGGSDVEARVALLPAVVRGRPASVLVRVGRNFEAAPVAVLEDALFGHGAGVVGRHGEGCFNVGIARSGRAEGLGARDHVVNRTRHLVHVEPEALVGGVDVAGDGDFLVLGDGELAGGGTLEIDLGAVDVELGLDDPALAFAGDVVHGGHLGAEQVGARGHAIWDTDAEDAVGVDDLLDRPLFGRLVVALVPDLEPAGAARVLVKVGDGLGIDGYRTLVRIVDEAGLVAVGVGAELEAHL